MWFLRKKMQLVELEHKLKLEHKETVTIQRLEFEAKIENMKLDHRKKTAELGIQYQQKLDEKANDYNQQIVELERKFEKEKSQYIEEKESEYYDRLTTAFGKLQLEGDKNSKFVQDLALKMVEKNPPLRTEHQLTHKQE